MVRRREGEGGGEGNGPGQAGIQEGFEQVRWRGSRVERCWRGEVAVVERERVRRRRMWVGENMVERVWWAECKSSKRFDHDCDV